MYPRGKARLESVHANPFDVASDVRVIAEVMSLKWHVEDGRLPNDTDKMLCALRTGYVYVMAHSEDYGTGDEMNFSWQRSVVHALRLADADRTPRLLHVRRNASWDAYDCMRDAALEAGFAYFDIFCGHANAYATEKLPGETLQQTTLDPTEPT